MTTIEVSRVNKSDVFKNACRICALFFNNDIHLIPIFSNIVLGHESQDLMHLTDKFHLIKELNFLELKVEEDDGLPQQICKKCISKLFEVYVFRENCKKSENIFKNYEFDVQLNTQSHKAIEITEGIEIDSDSEQTDTSSKNKSINQTLSIVSSNSKAKRCDQLECVKDSSEKNKSQNNCLKILFNETLNEEVNNCHNVKPMDIDEKIEIQINENFSDSDCNQNEQNENIFAVVDSVGEKDEIDDNECNYENGERDDGECNNEDEIDDNEFNNENDEIDINKYNIEDDEIDDNEDLYGNLSFINYDIENIESNGQNSNNEESFDEGGSEQPKDNRLKCYDIATCSKCHRSCLEVNIKYHYKVCKKEKTIRADKYFCMYCKHYSKNMKLLKDHILQEHSDFPIICYYCPYNVKTFSNENEYNNHISVHYINCNKCSEKFLSKAELKLHQREAHSFEKCKFCEEKFKYEAALVRHLKQVHDYEEEKFTIYNCEQCGKVFNNRDAVYKHKYAFHKYEDQSEFKCNICGKTYTSAKLYDYHVRSHNPDKKFKCNYCEKSFMQIHQWRNHETTHTGERPYKCEECDRSWKEYYGYKTHFEKHHPDNPDLILCDICGLPFAFQFRLKHHKLKAHGKEFPLSCDICNKKKFCTRTELNLHKKNVHALNFDRKFKKKSQKSGKHFGCPLCSKEFLLASSLDLHFARHKDSSFKFVCEICKFSYKTHSHLRRHKKLKHSNSTENEKSDVQNTFVKKVSEKEKKFSCNVCSKKLATEKGWQEHVRNHIINGPRECPICGKSFRSTEHLNVHDRLVHSLRNSETAEVAYNIILARNADIINEKDKILQ